MQTNIIRIIGIVKWSEYTDTNFHFLWERGIGTGKDVKIRSNSQDVSEISNDRLNSGNQITGSPMKVPEENIE